MPQLGEHLVHRICDWADHPCGGTLLGLLLRVQKSGRRIHEGYTLLGHRCCLRAPWFHVLPQLWSLLPRIQSQVCVSRLPLLVEINVELYIIIIRCWTDRKNNKRLKEHATEMAGLKSRKRQRWEASSDVREKHAAIREKYAIGQRNSLDNKL